jgi:hypothetical protein
MNVPTCPLDTCTAPVTYMCNTLHVLIARGIGVHAMEVAIVGVRESSSIVDLGRIDWCRWLARCFITRANDGMIRRTFTATRPYRLLTLAHEMEN